MKKKPKPVPVRMKAGAKKVAEVLIYEQIGADMWFGEGLTAKRFAEDLKALGDVEEINVRINSPGGSVHDGLAIFNTLAAHPARVTVDIDGLAASAASFVAMVGDEIRCAENAIVMIHLSQSMAMGDRHELERTAQVLAVHDQTIAQTYASRSGGDVAALLELMAAETWMSADEALKHKLIDRVTQPQRAEACARPEGARAYRRLPEAAKRFFAAAAAPATPAPKRKVKAMAKTTPRKVRNEDEERDGDDEGKKKPPEEDAATLADLLGAAVEEVETDERTRDAVVQELAEAAGCEPEDVEEVLSGDNAEPPEDWLAGFAGVDGMPSEEAMRAAAGYGEKEADESEEGGDGGKGEQAKLSQKVAWLEKQLVALQGRLVAVEGRLLGE